MFLYNDEVHVSIREETVEDWAAIREVNRVAFGGETERRLVDRLRSESLVIASLVAVEKEAVEKDRVVGHILFSELSIVAEYGVIRAAALAPVAVRPETQRRGVGRALVWRGLKLCRERGVAAVIVVGSPDYYSQFGFSAELARCLESPFSGEAFMALELSPGVLAGRRGTVKYPDAFHDVE